MIELFFHLAFKWPKWCEQTLHPFSQILKIFSGIWAPVVAPPSDRFQIGSLRRKGFSFSVMMLQASSKSANKYGRYFLLNNAHTSIGTVKRPNVIYKHTNKKSEKHHTSSSHADVRRSISTEFCTMVEVVRAIIQPCKPFWVTSIV